MPKLFLLFSHKLTPEQESEARRSLGVVEFKTLERELLTCWKEVPPDVEDIREHLLPIFEWVAENAQSGDYVLIQGEPGAVYLAIGFAFEQNLLPIYATTPRQVNTTKVSDKEIEKTSRFRHVRYRRYVPFKDD